MVKRSLRTAVSVYPSQKPHRRITIPQPEYKSFRISRRGGLKAEAFWTNPWWLTIHRRGLSRKLVGVNPLEARAVPKEFVRGTLPERILYAALITIAHQKPDVDFTFQSSLAGGRLELGGIVADFMFEAKKFAIQVQGPTHDTFLRSRKDEEQTMLLAELGYSVVSITDEQVYDEYILENFLRRLFAMPEGHGGSGDIFSGTQTTLDLFAAIYNNLLYIQTLLMQAQGALP